MMVMMMMMMMVMGKTWLKTMLNMMTIKELRNHSNEGEVEVEVQDDDYSDDARKMFICAGL